MLVYSFDVILVEMKNYVTRRKDRLVKPEKRKLFAIETKKPIGLMVNYIVIKAASSFRGGTLS